MSFPRARAPPVGHGDVRVGEDGDVYMASQCGKGPLRLVGYVLP